MKRSWDNNDAKNGCHFKKPNKIHGKWESHTVIHIKLYQHHEDACSVLTPWNFNAQFAYLNVYIRKNENEWNGEKWKCKQDMGKVLYTFLCVAEQRKSWHR